jgi:hypothetical protein
VDHQLYVAITATPLLDALRLQFVDGQHHLHHDVLFALVERLGIFGRAQGGVDVGL